MSFPIRRPRGAGEHAHSIKGAAANVAANGLSSIALEMEGAGKADRLDRIGELFPRAVEEFHRLRHAIETGWMAQETTES